MSLFIQLEPRAPLGGAEEKDLDLDFIKETIESNVKNNVVDTFKTVINQTTSNTFYSFKQQLFQDMQQLGLGDQFTQY